MNKTFPKHTIKPNARFDNSMILCFIEAIKNQYNRRDMIYQLFRKEFLGGYRKAFLGSVWLIITPLTGMISWVFLHYAQVVQPGNVGVPYPAYVLVGTLIWGLFVRICSNFMNAFQSYRFIITSINFPHEVIFGVTLFHILAEFFISFVISITLLILFKIELSWTIFYFPFVFLPLLFFAVAIGLLISVFSVVSYDMRQIVATFLRVLMFVVPIIYSTDVVTNQYIKTLIRYNPFTYLACSARDIVLFGKLYSLQGYLISVILSCIILVLAWRIFYVSEDIILERMM